MIDPSLLNHLVCPKTKTKLEYWPDSQELVSRVAGLVYPIRQGIPVLIPSQARVLDANAYNRPLHQRLSRSDELSNYKS
ncbi:MAG: Trm112 family protein [Gammaproteobacteria bacterium]|nr:Trm112 family protein [Gammaproteobacteria bacterium]